MMLWKGVCQPRKPKCLTILFCLRNYYLTDAKIFLVGLGKKKDMLSTPTINLFTLCFLKEYQMSPTGSNLSISGVMHLVQIH